MIVQSRALELGGLITKTPSEWPERRSERTQGSYAGIGPWVRERYLARRPSRPEAVYSEVKAKPRHRPALRAFAVPGIR